MCCRVRLVCPFEDTQTSLASPRNQQGPNVFGFADYRTDRNQVAVASLKTDLPRLCPNNSATDFAARSFFRLV